MAAPAGCRGRRRDFMVASHRRLADARPRQARSGLDRCAERADAARHHRLGRRGRGDGGRCSPSCAPTATPDRPRARGGGGRAA